jgi:hypothetical protein
VAAGNELRVRSENGTLRVEAVALSEADPDSAPEVDSSND